MKNFKKIFVVLMVVAMMFSVAMPIFASEETSTAVEATGGEDVEEDATGDDTIGDKAIAAAIVVGLAAAAGAIGMGMSIAKSAEAIARQPEAEGSIRTTLMLGLVFVETAIIYALVIAILIIFVL